MPKPCTTCLVPAAGGHRPRLMQQFVARRSASLDARWRWVWIFARERRARWQSRLARSSRGQHRGTRGISDHRSRPRCPQRLVSRATVTVDIRPFEDGSELAGTFSRMQHWSARPCVRTFSAVHMTAGHNALRGSGPDRKPAFDNVWWQLGCPDRQIDRLCITCCSSSQADVTSPGWWPVAVRTEVLDAPLCFGLSGMAASPKKNVRAPQLPLMAPGTRRRGLCRVRSKDTRSPVVRNFRAAAR
jgi:hypothetical protein